MLNSKQLLTGLITLLVLCGIYFAYNAAVGPLTDFDALEPDMVSAMEDDGKLPIEEKYGKEPEIAARRGFGPNCKELNCDLKIEYRDSKARKGNGPGRGGLFIYFDDYEISKEEPKKLRAHPISLVNIVPSADGEAADEISTVRGDEAIIEFDRPVDITKFQSANPIAGEIRGKLVELKNNRKSVDPEDDIVLFTEKLVYSEAKNLIWAPDWIRLTDRKLTAIGEGMEMELYPKDPPGQPRTKRKSQAKEVRLMRGVRIDLKLDDEENFLGGAANKTAAKPNEPKKPPTPVSIAARGTFAFNLETNRATFSKSVQVVRKIGDGPAKEDRIDQLECDDLVLQFEDDKDTAEGKTPVRVVVGPERDAKSAKETPKSAISTAATVAVGEKKVNRPEGKMKLVATTATGKQVILLSDGEKIQATGNYLFHDAAKKQSILRGDREMIAIHENAVIHASNLIIEQGDEKGVRHFAADGPDGWLEILEETKDGQPKPAQSKQKPKLKIRWQGKMVMTTKPGTETQIVTITDDVELDDERIALKCDKLRVWLVPMNPADAPTPSKVAGVANRQPLQGKLEPVRIEAEGRVAARSDDWDIFTQDLNVNIIRKRTSLVPPANAAGAKPAEQPLVAVKATAKDNQLQPPNRLPIESSPKAKIASTQPRGSVGESHGNRNGSTKSQSAASNPLADAKPRTDIAPEPKTPLEIRATRVALVVEREGTASRPISAWAEGSVLVTQAPKKPTDEPLEIRGQTLQFERKPDGDQMRVSGQGAALASIKTADISMFANKQIFLDEVNNKVNIPGQGYLIRETVNDMEGNRLAKPQLVRIDWERTMEFDGKIARFDGAVRAQQAGAELSCELMDVEFDQRIDFKEAREKRGDKERPKTQIDRVFCDQNVVALNVEREGDRIIRSMLLHGKALQYDNLHRSSKADGPGDLTIVDRSNPQRDANGKMKNPEHPFERTQVTFDIRMSANREHQTAKFYESVRILRAPVDGMDVPLDANKLPRDGIAVDASESVTVALTEKKDVRNGTTEKYRDFQAVGDVRVQGQDYSGTCDQLSFDEEKDLLIFNSQPGRNAKFFRQLSPGESPQETSARTIRFGRRSGKLGVEGITNLQSIETGGRDQRQPPRR